VFSEEQKDFSPLFPEGYVHVLECDEVTIASNFDKIENIQGANVTLICEAATRPGGDVMDGGFGTEEELYRRTDIERHTKHYARGEWPYPLSISTLDQGQAISISGVSCYRSDRNYGYALHSETSLINVVLASPRTKPSLIGHNHNYLLEHDREHMYMTLKAAFRAASDSPCDILVISDFGCRNLGHPAQEVASLVYKVI
jgi:hypothetical protein